MKTDQPASVTMRVRVGDSEIEISGPPDYVEKKIAEFLKQPPALSREATDRPAVNTRAATKSLSPAQFFKLCGPKTDNDRTLVAAYFLERYRNAESSTASEIRELIREAKVPPPRNPNDSVNQNIRKGLLMTAGDKNKKIAFVVTSDGEAAVEDMRGNKNE